MEFVILFGLMFLVIIISMVLNASSDAKSDAEQIITENESSSGVESEKGSSFLPEDAVVYMEGAGFVNGNQLEDMAARFQTEIGRSIKSHFRKLRKLAPGDKSLGFIINSSESLIPGICDKMSIALEDGMGHSFGISDINSNTFVSVSCWPCGLGELRLRFENQYGSYLNALSNYVEKAASLGFENFIHLFFCYSSSESPGKFGTTGITATYFNPASFIFIKPDELISDSEIEKVRKGH